MTTLITRNLKSLKKYLNNKDFKNKKIGLVPTMGAIHKGHLALVDRSKKNSDKTIVTIFVNPMQFNNKSDYKSYPMSLKNDINILTKKKVNLIFIPNNKDMYPDNFSTYIELKKYENILCGRKRKNHFSGVATVVLKLFSLVQPSVAYFGEKDFQQLIIIKKLVQDFNLNVKISAVKTVRDKQGLALSSRNKLLNTEQKKLASKINKILKTISYEKLNNFNNFLNQIMKILKNEGIKNIEYLEIRDEKTLDLFNPKYISNKKYRVFFAAKLGNVRIIDNIKI